MPRRHDCTGRNQRHRREREGCLARSQGGRHRAPERHVDEPHESRLEPGLDAGKGDSETTEPPHPMRDPHPGGGSDREAHAGASVRRHSESRNDHNQQEGQPELAERHARAAMAEMRRQHRLAFHQREHEAADDGGGGHRHELAHEAGGEQQRHERRDGRQYAKRDWHQHLMRTFDGAGELPAIALLRHIHRLAHHHRIVYQEAQGNDEADHGNGVDGIAEPVNEKDAAEKRNRDADADPERKVWTQEQRQHHQHHEQALNTAVDECAEAVREHDRLVLPERQFHPVRVARGSFGEIAAHRLADFLDVLVAHLGHLHQGCRLAVEDEALARVLEAVHNLRHVSQQHPRAVAAGGYDKALEFLAPIRLPTGAQQHFAGIGLDAAAGQIGRTLPQRRGHLIESEVVAQQRMLRNLHRNLVGPAVRQRHLGDSGERLDVVPHPAGEFLEGAFILGPRDGDFHDDAGVVRQQDDGLLGFLREGIDGVDGGFHLVQHGGCIHLQEQGQVHDANPFVGDGDHLLDPGNALHPLLDALANAGRHFLRRRAEIGHRDDDERKVHIRIDLHGNPRHRRKPREHGEAHHEIGRHMIRGKPGDHPLHANVPSRCPGRCFAPRCTKQRTHDAALTTPVTGMPPDRHWHAIEQVAWNLSREPKAAEAVACGQACNQRGVRSRPHPRAGAIAAWRPRMTECPGYSPSAPQAAVRTASPGRQSR